MKPTREDIIAEARTWVGTPYHHMGAVKGAGVDCAQLLNMIYSEVGLIERVDYGEYSQDWMLHRSEEKYLRVIMNHAKKVDHPLPGDVVLWKIGRCFSHAAVVVTWPEIIHSYKAEGCVYGLGDQGEFEGRECVFFSLMDEAK